MRRWGLALPMAALLLGACASVPTPATRSPKSPAHPEAPEAVTPPAAPVLLGGDDDSAPPLSTAPEAEMPMHRGHAMPSASPSPTPDTSAVYTCPMHPQVKADKPGACPICGMKLIRKGSK